MEEVEGGGVVGRKRRGGTGRRLGKRGEKKEKENRAEKEE